MKLPKKLSDYKVIFWDFDGVIKDSVETKTEAFMALFAEYGSEVQAQVKAHHEANGGISRFIKIEYYFKEFLQREISQQELENYCKQFSNLVLDKVVASPWVEGVLDFLHKEGKNQTYYIVTGTPQVEIEEILKRLELTSLFRGVYGYPKKKREVLQTVIAENKYPLPDCLMIGDAMTDYKAAIDNGVDFLLRKTRENRSVFAEIVCPGFESFTQFSV